MSTCASCGGAGLILDTRDIPHTYEGRTHVIKKVSGLFCPACGEVELDSNSEDGERFSREERAFVKKINRKLAEAAFIAQARKKLGLTQREAGQLFGGGHSGFSRYESGRTAPPVGLVALLDILDSHPELLDEVRAEAAAEAVPGRRRRGASRR
jgi:HTH-type transcriptional regulator/antitoxin MqsA